MRFKFRIWDKSNNSSIKEVKHKFGTEVFNNFKTFVNARHNKELNSTLRESIRREKTIKASDDQYNIRYLINQFLQNILTYCSFKNIRNDDLDGLKTLMAKEYNVKIKSLK